MEEVGCKEEGKMCISGTDMLKTKSDLTVLPPIILQPLQEQAQSLVRGKTCHAIASASVYSKIINELKLRTFF